MLREGRWEASDSSSWDTGVGLVSSSTREVSRTLSFLGVRIPDQMVSFSSTFMSHVISLCALLVGSCTRTTVSEGTPLLLEYKCCWKDYSMTVKIALPAI